MSAVDRARGWLVAVLAAALAGCTVAPFEDVVLSATSVSGAPDGVEVTSFAVSMPVGAVAEVAATPMSASGPLAGSFTFDLVSADPNVLGVEPALGQPAGAPVFVFFGVSAGTTQIEIVMNGQSSGTIAATVTAQPQ